MYLKQTPAIIPQQPGIVILSGCKRLELWSPARPHRLPMGWQRGHRDAPQPAALPGRRSGGPGCSQARPRPGQAIICSARLPCYPWFQKLTLPSPAPSPGRGHPVLLSLAPMQTLPKETARLPPKKKKKRAESPNLASDGSQPWQDHQGLNHQHPQDQHGFGSLYPSAPLGFPTSRMLQGKAQEARRFFPK